MLWVHFKYVLYVITMKSLGSFNQSSQCSQHVITGFRPPHPQWVGSNGWQGIEIKVERRGGGRKSAGSRTGLEWDQLWSDWAKRKWEFPRTQHHNNPLLTARRWVGSSGRGLPGDDKKGREGSGIEGWSGILGKLDCDHKGPIPTGATPAWSARCVPTVDGIKEAHPYEDTTHMYGSWPKSHGKAPWQPPRMLSCFLHHCQTDECSHLFYIRVWPSYHVFYSNPSYHSWESCGVLGVEVRRLVDKYGGSQGTLGPLCPIWTRCICQEAGSHLPQPQCHSQNSGTQLLCHTASNINGSQSI